METGTTLTSSTDLFATLITVDGISCDSRPSICGDNKNVLKLSLKYSKNSAESWCQLLVSHVAHETTSTEPNICSK